MYVLCKSPRTLNVCVCVCVCVCVYIYISSKIEEMTTKYILITTSRSQN